MGVKGAGRGEEGVNLRQQVEMCEACWN